MVSTLAVKSADALVGLKELQSAAMLADVLVVAMVVPSELTSVVTMATALAVSKAVW